MYTSCSFYQVIKLLRKLAVYLTYFILSRDKLPTATINFSFEIIRSRSAFAWSIRAFSNKLLDWMTSSVVLVFPESYSNVMPSLAISAALTCASVAIKTLSADW